MSIPEVSSRNRLLQFLKKHFSQTSFHSRMVTSQTLNQAAWAKLEFGENTYSSNDYDASSYVFTAPFEGKYYFELGITWYQMATSTDQIDVALSKNNGLATQVDYYIGTSDYAFTSNADVTQYASTILQLSAGDTISAYGKYTNGTVPSGTEVILGTSIAGWYYSQFMGYRV